MVTLTLLGLWMFLSLTLVKEGDLGARIRRPSAVGINGSGGASTPGRRQQPPPPPLPPVTTPVNGRRSSLTRKEVTVGVVQVRCGRWMGCLWVLFGGLI